MFFFFAGPFPTGVKGFSSFKTFGFEGLGCLRLRVEGFTDFRVQGFRVFRGFGGLGLEFQALGFRGLGVQG